MCGDAWAMAGLLWALRPFEILAPVVLSAFQVWLP